MGEPQNTKWWSTKDLYYVTTEKKKLRKFTHTHTHTPTHNKQKKTNYVFKNELKKKLFVARFFVSLFTTFFLRSPRNQKKKPRKQKSIENIFFLGVRLSIQSINKEGPRDAQSFSRFFLFFLYLKKLTYFSTVMDAR